jgi:tetratricopeptide (TPR) repeat protein
MKALPALAAALVAVAAQAVVLQPMRDDEVVERLPPAAPGRGTAVPSSPQEAAQRALALTAQARRTGDPRPAGQALALLRPWQNDARAPAPVVIALADAEQHLHRFDAARERLQALVAREAPPPQAWLMLATLQRLQGRYADSEVACAGLRRSGAALHAAACAAENAALRGEFDTARARLQDLLRAAPDAATQAWLGTTLAELEQRAGRPRVAEAAFRAALRSQPDHYTTLALADLLLEQGRAAEALALLRDEPDSDAVLLRRAMASPRADNEAAAELRRRFAQADLRPGAAEGHERERALFALYVEHDTCAALRHARANVHVQREPTDLLLLLRAARAAGDTAARQQARQVIEEMGLEDHRLQALY